MSRVSTEVMQALEQPATEDPGWDQLRRVADGDSAAFDAFMREQQDRVLAVCQRLLGDRAEAEDSTQEVFLKAFHRAGRLEPRGLVSTWLYRVAVNHCLNRLRRRRIVRFLPLVAPSRKGESAGAELDPPAAAADPEISALARERWRRTERAIDRLPASQRAVLVLAKFEGLSYREIAEVMEITEKAVESRLVRAMRSLRSAQET